MDEISDIGAPLRDRYHERGAGISRCLKLSMTDGVQRVIGIEYQPITALRNLFPAGFKICVRNVFVRRGVFLLSCESVEIIGGLVQRLEEARLRAVHEVNKPARGNRNLRGQTGDSSLIDWATAAAWPRNTNGANPAAAVPIPPDTPSGHSVQPLQPTAASIFQSFATQGQPPHSVQASQLPDTDTNGRHGLHVSHTETRLHASLQQGAPAVVPTRSETRSNVPVQQVAPAAGPMRTETRLNVTVQQSTSAVGSTVQSLEVRRKQTTIPWVQKSMNDAGLQESGSRMQTKAPGSHGTQQRVLEQNTTHDRFAPPSGMQTPMNLDSDEDEFESLSVPPRRHNTPAFSEEPFTYLALLKEKLSADHGYNGAVGKIKCVLTGVKDFQYKDCDEFTLIVHIDDGSLVTEALIHHDVVQKMVGFSPKEVNSSLAKSNSQESREMKSNMKRFQLFLKKFEGLVHVQYKQSLGMPVISHMEEGVTHTDLAALQNRVGKDSLRQRGPKIKPEFIDVSP